MRALSIEEQIGALRPTMGFAAHLQRWLLWGAAVGVTAAIVLWNPIPLMIAAFLAVVGFSEKRAGPNIVAAVHAFDLGTPTQGEVSVRITQWDMDDHYHATVHEQGQPDWEYEFVPQGWTPEERTYAARVWRNDATGPPVLAAVDAGILIPRYDPKAVATG